MWSLRSLATWLTGDTSDEQPGSSSIERPKKDTDNDNESVSPWSTHYGDDDYLPTILDVLVVKAMLAKALRLPAEIVDSILDQAEYWPHTSVEVDYTKSWGSAQAVRGGPRTQENLFLVSRCSLCRSPTHPCSPL